MKKPRYVATFTDRHGQTRAYLRAPGQAAIPLPVPVGSPEFMDAYEEAIATVATREARGGKDAERRIGMIERRIWEGRTVPQSGIYLLVKGVATIVYIGTSADIRARVLKHRQHGRDFDRAYAFEAGADSRIALEKALIRAVKPKQNRTWTGGGFQTSEFEKPGLKSVAVGD